jgi:uncharacterized protein YeaO (DUF488 family)
VVQSGDELKGFGPTAEAPRFTTDARSARWLPVQIRTKRIYEEPASSDGRRILIDRLWPRGVSKEAAQIDYWAKAVAPSNELRRWYRHDPSKWSEFRDRYFAELDSNPQGVAELRAQLGPGPATLLFGSKEESLNNASALGEYLIMGEEDAA